MACQRITNAVCYICEMAGHHPLSYLDDFIGVATPDIAWQAYDYCGHLLAELGLEESLSKACPPATIQTCLGVQFDTVQMTLSVTPTRLTEMETLLVSWSTKKSATKSELQSLVGKLSFISKCIRQSRLFLSRILALLRTLRQNGHRLVFPQSFAGTLRGGFASCGPITAFQSFPRWSGLLPTPCSPLTHAYRDVVA
ncbi:unnamed protein product [Porites lobata]|uniref:Reverse transcriptase domain-containing protein n=1 Tax=Porites lobata TaxID=104759 RepID=A0ABN8NX10_9CNID|nr:unnamed protein product [Porites lobata]